MAHAAAIHVAELAPDGPAEPNSRLGHSLGRLAKSVQVPCPLPLKLQLQLPTASRHTHTCSLLRWARARRERAQLRPRERPRVAAVTRVGKDGRRGHLCGCTVSEYRPPPLHSVLHAVDVRSSKLHEWLHFISCIS